MKKINLAVSAICIILSMYVLREASTFTATVIGSDPTGPAFFPRLTACILILLAVLLVARTIWPARAVAAAVEETETSGFAPPTLIGMALLVVYVLVLEPLGFIVATVALLLAYLLVCGVRKSYVLAAYPIACSFLVYYVFRKLLMVYLPEGIFYF